MCSGSALLFLAMISASAQQVQRNPIVVHATAHTTTPLAFRDMTPVPWHNASRVMPEHDRAPHPHISSVPPKLNATTGQHDSRAEFRWHHGRAGWRFCAARYQRFRGRHASSRNG